MPSEASLILADAQQKATPNDPGWVDRVMKIDISDDQPTTEKTPRAPPPADKPTTPRTSEAKPKRLQHASKDPSSTLASAGSNAVYSKQAPFGSALSRFSPSMTFAHQVPVNAKLPRHRQPNRRWQPATLGEEEHGTQASLSDLAGTPASDRLTVKVEDSRRDKDKEGSASVAGEAPPSVSARSEACSHNGSFSARRSSQQSARTGRPASSAGGSQSSRASSSLSQYLNEKEEKELHNRLRREIDQMRDEKLRALREQQRQLPEDVVVVDEKREEEGSSRPPTASSVGGGPVSCALGELDCGRNWEEQPLQRLARVTRIVRPPVHNENEPPKMSEERASLLSFIAGEVRRR